jgi:hypothetical protein
MGSQALTILGQRALGYAASGVPVFPCVPGGKVPLTPSGFCDATTDPAVITTWWTRHRQANVAAPTGAPAFDVLDVDVRADGSGWDAFHEARRAGLIDGWVRAVQTPSGGLHLHYPGTEQRNGTIRGRHLDFRGQGGYVLLPPSLGQTKAYSREYITLDQRPGGRPLDWAAIVGLLDPPAPPLDDSARTAAARSAEDPTRWLTAHLARQPEGNRNSALFWATHRAVEAHVADFEPLITAAVQAGLPEAEARRTVTSARAATGQRTPPRPASSVHRDPAHVVGR